MILMDKLKEQASRLKHDTLTIYCALCHPDTPRLARWLAVLVFAYALSPIDLIPDFIPVLGFLDELILLPLGIALVLKLLPPALRDICRSQASRMHFSSLARSSLGAALVIACWVSMGLLLWWLWP